MTNEEFERRMEFIIEHQAQFVSDVQQLQGGIRQLREAQARTEQIVASLAEVTRESLTTTLEGFRDVDARIEALVDSQVRLTEAQSRTDQHLKDTDAKIDALVDSQIRLNDAHLRLTEAQSRLTEAQLRTDENLRTLSATVDRYLREGRNGGSGPNA